jgi:hypothetical protein
MPYPKEVPTTTYAKGTMPVGTVNKVFEPYSPPMTAAPTTALNETTVSVGLQNTSTTEQTNVPFTFGQVFKKGRLSRNDALLGILNGTESIALQFDVKATHQDGSVRHAIISGIIRKLGIGSSIMALRRVDPYAILAASARSMPSPLKVVITGASDQKVWVAEVTSSTPVKEVWLDGPVVSDLIYSCPFVDAAGNRHPYLSAQFCVRTYGSTATKTDVVVEATKGYTPTPEITYSAQVFVGSNDAAYTVNGLVHIPYARWKKTFWNQPPALHIKHDAAYLIDTKAIPSYDQTVIIPESILAGYAAELNKGKFVPMGFGVFSPGMATTGGRPEIGIMPDTYVAAILSGDKRAKDMMLASADVAGSWCSHRRDDTGRPIDLNHFPYSAEFGSASDCTNPMTGKTELLPSPVTSAGRPDSSHMAGFAYVPYMLTGDFYYLEELHFWLNFALGQFNPYYRQYIKGWVKPDQVRGQAWSIRTLAEAAYITPDWHEMKQFHAYLVESNFEYYNTRYLNDADNKLGVITNGYAVAYPVNGQNNVGMAPWMDDFFTSAVGHAYELGFESALPLLKWKSKFQIGRMTTPGVCWLYAAIYSLAIKPTETGPYFDNLADCYKFSQTPEVYAAPCVGDMTGYPGATAGFPANFQPALAIATDITGDLTAWSLFASRKLKPDYGTAAQFAIVPRLTLGTAVQPSPIPAPIPAPTTAPTTAPTQQPTPAPSPAPTPYPTNPPDPVPTAAPTPAPTAAPTQAPTAAPAGPGADDNDAEFLRWVKAHRKSWLQIWKRQRT